MDEFNEKINGRYKITEDLSKDVAEIQNRINKVQKSVCRKRQRIDEHKECEKRYRQTNGDLKKNLTKPKQINGVEYQQLPKDALQSLDFTCTQIENLIEQQHASGKQMASIELVCIQPSVEKLHSSNIVDCLKQLSQNLDHYSEKVKKENKAHAMSDDQEVYERKKVQTGIKRECSERVSEGRRLLQAKDRLEHETKETELKLAKRVKELCNDPTIQSAFKKSLRLKAACQQVRTEVKLTKAQMEKIQHQIQTSKTNDFSENTKKYLNIFVNFKKDVQG